MGCSLWFHALRSAAQRPLPRPRDTTIARLGVALLAVDGDRVVDQVEVGVAACHDQPRLRGGRRLGQGAVLQVEVLGRA